MTQVIDWLKSNVLIVVFAVLVVGAFVALPMVSGNMNASVQERIKGREGLDRDLKNVANTPVGLTNPSPLVEPFAQQPTLINPAALRAFEAHTGELMAEAEGVLGTAGRHNSKGRGVLKPELLPTPTIGREDVLRKEMSEALNAAYAMLLEDLRAGAPPTLKEMQGALVRQQKQFITTTLAREPREELTEEEQSLLREQLGARRLSLCQDRARTIGLYATIHALGPKGKGLPSWDYGQSPKPTMDELFQWQWDYWAIEDIVRAIQTVNGPETTALDAPVKRIVSIASGLGASVGGRGANRGGDDDDGPAGPGGGRGPFLGGGGAGGGADGPPPGGGNRGGGNDDDETEAGPAPFDPGQEVERDFSQSLTGRATNGLYDVRMYSAHLVVETARIADVLDAIGQRNFMTVVGLNLWPTDPYAELEEGRVYGSVPTTQLVLDIETIWLRSWTTDFMPDETKLALEIPIKGDVIEGDESGGNP